MKTGTCAEFVDERLVGAGLGVLHLAALEM